MPSTQDASARSKATVPIVVAVVAALVTGTMLLSTVLGGGEDKESAQTPVSDVSRDGSRPPVDEKNDPFAALVRRDPKDAAALGEVDAPVVMINYSEFQCPFCGKFARDTKPELMKYVEDGTMRIEWRHFPYLGPESITSAKASWAAGEQGRFWEYHDAMFADQQPPNSGKLTDEYLLDKAREIGLDVERFEEDMTSKTAADEVQADFDEGQEIGVTGTPAFLVNGRPIMGAQPTEAFVEAIEQAAQDAQ